MQDLETIAERVKHLRTSMDLTLEELASLVKVDYQNIQNVEGGRVSRPRFIEPLAQTLNVTVEYLLTGIDPNVVNDKILSDCLEVVAEYGDQLSFAQQSRLAVYLYDKALSHHKKLSAVEVKKLVVLFS